MAGSTFTNAYETIFGRVQKNLRAFTVSDKLAGREAHNALASQGGKVYQYTDYSDGTAQTVTQYSDMTIDTYTANKVSLTLDTLSSFTFNIDEFDKDKYRGVNEFLKNRAVNALKLLQKEQDGDWLNNYSSANTSFDDGDIGGTSGNPVTLSESNSYKVGNKAVGILERQMGFSVDTFWVVDPVMISELSNTFINKGFSVSDSNLKNGFVGQTFTGINVFKSNYLTHEITYTNTGNVSADDTYVINGLTYTFKAAPSAVGEVDVGSDAETSFANLAAAISQGAGAGTAYIAFTATTSLRVLRGLTASSTATTLTVIGKWGVMTETESMANVTAGTQFAHTIIGESGSIELANPMGIKNLERNETKQATTNFLSIQQYGTAVDNIRKFKFLDVRVTSS